MLNNNSGKEYFGEEFVQAFESILLECLENQDFLFIHGTLTRENAEDILKSGLQSDYPELNYTARMMKAEDRLLYDKLKSWPFFERKFLVMCVVPKNSGKGGVPIWKNGICGEVVLLPEFIRGYIDVNQRSIVPNELYSNKHTYENMIEDISFLPITGQFTQISPFPEEENFWEENLGYDVVDK